MPRERLYKRDIKELSSQTKINLMMFTQRVFVPDVFAFVVLGDGYVAAVGFQVVHLYGSIGVVLDGKGRVNHARHVVLTVTKCAKNKKIKYTKKGRTQVAITQ